MNTETIERQRYAYCSRITCQTCNDRRDILAVLEVAREWTTAYRRWHTGYNTKADFQRLTWGRDTLLALFEEGI